MRKIFSLIAAVLFAGSMMAEATVLYTLDATADANKTSNNGYATEGTVTVSGVTWACQGNGTMAPWRIGGKSLTNEKRVVYTKTAYGYALESIDLTIGAASSVTINSITLTHSLNADFSDGTVVNAPSKAPNSKISFAPEGGFPANSYFKFTFDITISGTSNKFIEFKKVEFLGEAPSDPEISCGAALDFGVVFGKTLASVDKVLEIAAYNLTENIAAALETGAAYSLAAASVDKAGGDLTITFAPENSGLIEDKLTLSSAGATSVEVALSGKAVKTEHEGNNADPFVVEEAREIAFAHADGVTTKDSISVTGAVVKVLDLNDGRLSFSIGAGNDTVLCYRTYDAAGAKSLTINSAKVGDIVVVRGKLQNFKSGANNIAEVAYGKLISVEEPGPGTAISNTAVEAKAVKRFVNGQLVIEKNGVLYNALGTQLR